MRWGIMSALSVSLVEQMGSQPKWSVIFIFYISDFLTTSGCQGELAHKVVKRLYGSTNKRHAEQQIAKRYRRLERARLALDRKQLHARTQKKLMDNKDDQVEPEGDSDLRYYISPSKNQPVDIFDTIRNNRGDPAYHVCVTYSNYCDC
jgi:hypothetical protein